MRAANIASKLKKSAAKAKSGSSRPAKAAAPAPASAGSTQTKAVGTLTKQTKPAAALGQVPQLTAGQQLKRGGSHRRRLTAVLGAADIKPIGSKVRAGGWTPS